MSKLLPNYEFPCGSRNQDLKTLKDLKSQPLDAIAESKQRMDRYVGNGEKAGVDFFNLGIGAVNKPISAIGEARKIVAKRMEKEAGYVGDVGDLSNQINKLIFQQKGDLYEGRSDIFGGDEQKEFEKDLLINDPSLYEGRIVSVLAHGGTNADYMAMIFWRQTYSERVQFIGEYDAWPNYKNIINQINPDNDSKIRQDYLAANADLEPSLQNLINALQSSVNQGRKPVVEVQPGAQNGLGLYRTPNFWDKYLEICEYYGAGIHFDSPYAGLTSTSKDFENYSDPRQVEVAMAIDWYPIRKAAEMGLVFSYSESLSKTMSFYSGRVGMLGVNIPQNQGIDIGAVQDQLNKINRAVNSFGSEAHRIVNIVMQNKELFTRWLGEYGEKVIKNVHLGREALAKNAPLEIRAIIERTRGMFATFPMSKENSLNLEAEKPRIITVHSQSATLSGNAEKPTKSIRVNTAAIGLLEEELRDQIAKRILEKVA